jgi:four helix bundle protein
MVMSDSQIRSFRDLKAWQVAMDLAVEVHRHATALPATHRYEIGSQLRKAATSVPSNIAEGHAHRGERTYLRHVPIALGSLAEVETQVELAVRLKLFDGGELTQLTELIARSGQLLHGLERSLKRRVAGAIAVGCLSAVCLASLAVAFG